MSGSMLLRFLVVEGESGIKEAFDLMHREEDPGAAWQDGETWRIIRIEELPFALDRGVATFGDIGEAHSVTARSLDEAETLETVRGAVLLDTGRPAVLASAPSSPYVAVLFDRSWFDVSLAVRTLWECRDYHELQEFRDGKCPEHGCPLVRRRDVPEDD